MLSLGWKDSGSLGDVQQHACLLAGLFWASCGLALLSHCLASFLGNISHFLYFVTSFPFPVFRDFFLGVFVCVCWWVHTCVCLWRPEMDVGCLPQSIFSYLIFLTQECPLNLEVIIGTSHCAFVCVCVCGRYGFQGLDKHFSDWVISQALPLVVLYCIL